MYVFNNQRNVYWVDIKNGDLKYSYDHLLYTVCDVDKAKLLVQKNIWSFLHCVFVNLHLLEVTWGSVRGVGEGEQAELHKTHDRLKSGPLSSGLNFRCGQSGAALISWNFHPLLPFSRLRAGAAQTARVAVLRVPLVLHIKTGLFF